jgi:hypothetical protein
VRCRVDDLKVGIDKGGLVLPRSAEVQQADLVRGGVVQEVGPVGVSLHVAVQEQLSGKSEVA